MNIDPESVHALQNCVLIEPDMEKHHLFTILRQKHTGTGKVLAVGPAVEFVKVGDRALFGDHIGQELNCGSRYVLVMREDHILGVFGK